MIIRIARFLCLVLFIGLAAGCSKRVADLEQVNPEEKIVVRFSHVVAENTPKGLAAQRFATLVKERTKGKVEVQVFPNSTLYKDGEELQALQSGAVQIIAPSTSKISGIYPQWQILDLPYAFPDENTVHKAMSGYIGSILYDGFRQNNLLELAFWDSGFKQMTNSVRPLRYPGDFAGLTFRVMIKSQVLKRQFDLLGARSAEVNFSDLYQTLVNHEVDGEENTISNICSKNLYKVQPYITISNHGYMGYVVLTNAGFWAGLPPDLRGILESTMSEVTDWERQQALIMNKEGLEQITSSGNVQLRYQTEAEKRDWQSRLKPIYEEFAGVIGEDLVNSVEEINKSQQ